MNRSRSGLSHEELDRLRLIAKGKVRKAYSQPSPANDTTGLRMYDLRGPASRFIPRIATLRNRIPRRQSPGGTSVHWKAITGINTGNILPGVSEGNRNAPIAQTTADYFQVYAGLGMENFNTFEAAYAMKGFADARALARLDTLESLINAEERVILGGNNSVAFGIPATPVGTIVATGGALTAQSWRCYVVALTAEGKLLASVSGGVATSFSRTNADGSVDTIHGGSSNKSLESAGVVSAGANSILWSTTSIRGAFGYAWYVGLTGAANCHLAAITDTNEFLQVADPSGATQAASAITADNSQNPLAFDGIVTQLAKSGSGAQFHSMNGAPFTVNGAGTIDEINTLFESMWNSFYGGPTVLLINASTRVNLTNAVMAAGGGTPNIVVNVDINSQNVKTGMTVSSILNPFTGQYVGFESHPYMPKGMIVGLTERLPYAIPGVGGPWVIETRQEYYSIDWPLRTRKNEFGVYVDEALIGTTPFAHMLIQDIGEA